MIFKHIRNATSLLTYNRIKILIDPCLAKKNTFRNVPIKRRNFFVLLKKHHPFCDITTEMSELLECDIVLSTHRHFDHFDKSAKELLNKEKPLVCQNIDASKFCREGFKSVIPIDSEATIMGIKIIRIYANHGVYGGKASGYILKAKNEPTLYLAGDTIYTEEIKKTIEQYKPEIIILNGGGAKVVNTRLIMNIPDIEKTLKVSPTSQFIIVHLDTIYHCLVTRKMLREYFNNAKLKALNVQQFFIPEDNESIEIKKYSKK